MKTKLRATVTIVQEYEADSKNYNNVDFVEDMIHIDKNNFRDDPIMFIDGMLDEPETKATIKIVKAQ